MSLLFKHLELSQPVLIFFSFPKKKNNRMSDIFSLKKQLVVYGSHHNNKVNVAIHMIFVPTIFWTGKA